MRTATGDWERISLLGLLEDLGIDWVPTFSSRMGRLVLYTLDFPTASRPARPPCSLLAPAGAQPGIRPVTYLLQAPRDPLSLAEWQTPRAAMHL
jgi:hypothetical protein